MELSHVKNDLSQVRTQYAEAKDESKRLEHEAIQRNNEILELQTVLSKGVEESGQLQRELKKVQDLLVSVEQSSAAKIQEYSDWLAKEEKDVAALKGQLAKKRELISSQKDLLSGAEGDKD